MSTQQRDEGMGRASSHAENNQYGWNDSATQSLLAFAYSREASSRKSFLAEEWVEWALTHGLTDPPDRRAFGPIVNRASRNGLIRKVGYGLANTSNSSPKCLWQKA